MNKMKDDTMLSIAAVRGMEQLAKMGMCVVWSIMPSGKHRIAVGETRLSSGEDILHAEADSLPEAFERLLTKIEEKQHDLLDKFREAPSTGSNPTTPQGHKPS